MNRILKQNNKPVSKLRQDLPSSISSVIKKDLILSNPLSLSSVLMTLGILLSPFLFSGCTGTEEPEPTIHKKQYTLDELEAKYRTIQKRPAEYNVDANSISSQKRRFNSELRSTFNEIDEYKKDIDVADKIASKKEKKIRKQARVTQARKTAKKQAKKSVSTSGSVINAYYN